MSSARHSDRTGPDRTAKAWPTQTVRTPRWPQPDTQNSASRPRSLKDACSFKFIYVGSVNGEKPLIPTQPLLYST